MTEQATALLSPKGLCNFVHLFEAKPGLDGGEPKFSVILIFDKAAQATPEFARMREKTKEAISKKWGSNVPPVLRSPFRPSSEKAHLGFPADCVFITATTAQKPGVVDELGQDIIDRNACYSGMFGRASLNVYAYDKGGNKGVAFGLNNFQKMEDGTRVAGRASAQSDFGVVNAGDANVDLDALLNA